MMQLLLYAGARLVMGIFALVCVDALTNTALAAEPSSIAAAFGLIVIADVIVYSNNGTST